MSDVTVIIPVKNAAKFVDETLRSLERQTLEDFDVMVWDNDSTDGTLEILNQWIPDRLPGLVISGQPLPYDECLAELVCRATTPFLARIDADDIATPDRLERQLLAMKEDPGLAAVGGQMEFIDSNGIAFGSPPQLPESFVGILSRMMCQSPLPHPGTMLRREAVLDVGNYRALQPTEDLDLWMRLAQKYRLKNLNSVVLRYRRHEMSVTELAKSEGDHTEKIFDRLCKNSLQLFGLNPADYMRLLQKEKVLSVTSLIRVAKSISQRSDVSLKSVLRSSEFCNSCRMMVSPRDLVTKTWIALNDRKENEGLAKRFARGLVALPRVRSLTRMVANWKQRRARSLWHARQRRLGRQIEDIDIRGCIDWEERISIGDAVAIEPNVMFTFQQQDGCEARIDIGANTFIGRNSIISACAAVRIGSQVLIGANCYLSSNDHRFETRAVPVREQGYDASNTTLEDGCWLGANVTVLKGVRIGRGAVVGAGAVVNKDVPAFEIWVGVPAKKIGERA